MVGPSLNGNVLGKKFVKYKFIKGQSSGGKMCGFCGKSSHTIDSCFKKHGFAPNFKEGNRGSSNSVSAISNDCENEVEVEQEDEV